VNGKILHLRAGIVFEIDEVYLTLRNPEITG